MNFVDSGMRQGVHQNFMGSDVGRWDSADSHNLRYFIEFKEPGQ